MKFKITGKNEFLIIGMSLQFESNSPEASKRIPELWRKFTARIREIQGVKSNVCYGICACVSGSTGDRFEYTAGIEVSDIQSIPQDMIGKTIPASKYVVFTHKGSLTRLCETLDNIFKVWLPASEYKRNKNIPDFEYYDCRFNPKNPEDENSEFDIYVPVL